jgi:ferrous iron transport protein B
MTNNQILKPRIFVKTSFNEPKKITIALAGNPNAGKTTIFNNLTGANQHVGNYGGVTVETKEGSLRFGEYLIQVVDLPGTYSLTAYSIEEIVARDFIIHEQPDVIVDIVDGSNLERNLYLTMQIRELGAPLVVALNMADEMKKKGISVDLDKMSQDLGAAVIPTVGTRKKGMKRLLDAIIEVVTGQRQKPDAPAIRYGEDIDAELDKIAQPITDFSEKLRREDAPLKQHLCLSTSPQWVALKLLENDKEVLRVLADGEARMLVQQQVEISRKHLTAIFGEEPEIVIAEQRYGYVRGICREVVSRTAEARMDLSARIDRVLTNRLLGLPIFAILMYLTFYLVFSVGEIPMGWIESGIGFVLQKIELLWPAGRAEFLQSLICEGVIAGVGNVIVFLPNIMLLFMAITLLEDTGYMARAAFIMDRLMKWVGLHGKSFIPMLTGFGCTVPAIMGTRVLDNRRDRLTTMMVLPLMSCGARFPIYALIIPAFFAERYRATAMYAIYLIGIALAIVVARLLRSTLFKGEASPFVMELPPYRIPTGRAILIHTWQRSRMYLRKAGTIILALSIVMWFLTSYPTMPPEKQQEYAAAELAEAQVGYSFAGRIGHAMEPALEPLGFDWKIGTALVGAFAAKEVFVAQLGIVYAIEDTDALDEGLTDADKSSALSSEEKSELATLRGHLQASYSPLVGFCIMLFCLIATPCMATVAVTRREAGGWRWALLQFGGLTAVAYVITLLVYQVGTVLQIGI